MTKEQEIFKNMKEIGRRRHTLKKSHGRWWVSHPTLVDAIEQSGFKEAQAIVIISRMEAKGYVHTRKDVNGRAVMGGGYVIDKWEN